MSDYTESELKQAAQRCANVYAKLANQKFGCSIPIPVPINFNLCDTDPKASGMAYRTIQIGVNMILFEDNLKEILNDTIPHEIAHLVQFLLFDEKGKVVQGHGAEWQEIMKKLGKQPSKYHKLDVSKAIKHYKKVKSEKRKILKGDH